MIRALGCASLLLLQGCAAISATMERHPVAMAVTIGLVEGGIIASVANHNAHRFESAKRAGEGPCLQVGCAGTGP